VVCIIIMSEYRMNEWFRKLMISMVMSFRDPQALLSLSSFLLPAAHP
jgi:hypothetical protein